MLVAEAIFIILAPGIEQSLFVDGAVVVAVG